MQQQLVKFFSEKPVGTALVLPIHGYLKNDGSYPMGGEGYLGVAKRLFKGIDKKIAEQLNKIDRPRGRKGLDTPRGMHVVQVYDKPIIFAMPVKYGWWERADLSLVDSMSRELRETVDIMKIPEVYIYPFGEGTPWSEIESTMAQYLDRRFIVCAPD